MGRRSGQSLLLLLLLKQGLQQRSPAGAEGAGTRARRLARALLLRTWRWVPGGARPLLPPPPPSLSLPVLPLSSRSSTSCQRGGRCSAAAALQAPWKAARAAGTGATHCSKRAARGVGRQQRGTAAVQRCVVATGAAPALAALPRDPAALRSEDPATLHKLQDQRRELRGGARGRTSETRR